MKPQDIHLTDWMRILVGEVPLSFFIELIIRAFCIYVLLLISMRSMGKRMSSQLSRNELAALVSLAAAIGVPMMAPDRGILPAFVIAFVLIMIERLIAGHAFKNQSFEKYSQGNISTLIKDAVIDVKVLENVGLSRQQLFAQLRSGGITQLGKVKRLYMEANGSFTLIENEEAVEGLSIIPAWDEEFKSSFELSPDTIACDFCGHTEKNDTNHPSQCPNCGNKNWATAFVK
jgi:uncharacterized membrane protein YcaP (DUF421 family)